MSVTRPQFSIKNSEPKGFSVTCLICATLCLFFFTAVPALAEPVRINQVVQTLSTSQGVPDIRLNSLITQDTGQKGAQQTGPRTENGSSTPGPTKTDTIVAGGVTVTGQGQQIGVQTYPDGEVEGTICDCGFIVPGGGFPKWPFLFLGAIPLAFIDHCDDCDTPPSNPTPTPTPTPPSTPTPTPTPQVPEPTSLLLFGTGLAAAGAGLRRRYAKAQLAQAVKPEEE
ncbi:MAG TPA: PEP-CTERM sorting domain-containing protein [Pyrinomonadaceae bacterium]|jgi:hypothetical protein|nr:PEP-CTERM sorting domain-containing protein [Pyrinomonadaceae bacterium]